MKLVKIKVSLVSAFFSQVVNSYCSNLYVEQLSLFTHLKEADAIELRNQETETTGLQIGS